MEERGSAMARLPGVLARLVRDPLFAFVLIGGAVFLADALWQGRSEDRVVVTAGDVNLLAELWASGTGRPPTSGELDSLVENHITEERMVREARRLGLDRNDSIIRRRLAQKLTFLVEDLAGLDPATEEELRTWFEARRGQYEQPVRVTFDHIYFRGDAGNRAAATARAALEDADSSAWRELGDPSLLARTYKGASREGVCSDFGPAFCDALEDVAPGPAWQGPLPSTYGAHLVRVIKRTPAGLPDYETVRDRVRADHEQELRAQAGADLLEGLRERYPAELP